MSPQEFRSTEQIEPVPENLESAQAKLVYIYLEATAGATVDELGQALTMKKIDILSVLNSLSSSGFVEKRGETYVVTA